MSQRKVTAVEHIQSYRREEKGGETETKIPQKPTIVLPPGMTADRRTRIIFMIWVVGRLAEAPGNRAEWSEEERW